MKILLAVTNGRPYGAERIVRSLGVGLTGLGCEVVVVCPEGTWLDGELVGAGVRTSEIADLGDFRPDIINSHARHFLNLRSPGAIHVATVNRQRFSFSHASADRWITLFEGCRGSAWRARAWGKRIKTIPPGVAVPVKRELPGKQGRVLASVGRITRSKGQALAIKALEQLGRIGYDDLQLRLVGAIDREYEAEFMEILNASKVRERVTLVGEVTDPSEALAGADLLLHPSTSDGTPLSIAEAMMLGIPVVATRIGGIPEMISHGETGFLSPFRPESFVEFIATALEDGGKVARRGQEFALNQFDEETMVKSYHDYFVSLTS